MTNTTAAIILTTLVTNSVPTTNWLTPDGKLKDVITHVQRQAVTHYTNEMGIVVMETNLYRHMELPRRYIKEERWVEVEIPDLPPVRRMPPLPQNR